MKDSQIPLNASSQYFTDVHLNDHFSTLDDHAPKVRKPYTMTKQRERWTDEEHNRFLKAVNKYGRAWRHIEEYVGNKTVVQIRSHAQKFFSKIIRDGSGSNASSVKPIEIPPPRPKQKSIHPYPRKNPPKSGVLDPSQHVKFLALNLLSSERENQSPTSVLSKFDIKPKDDVSTAKDEPTLRVKLFGTTLFVSDSNIRSSSDKEDVKSVVGSSSRYRMSNHTRSVCRRRYTVLDHE